jgi:SAM-dependent methyltransferase
LARALRKIDLQKPTVIDAGCGLGFNVQAIASVLPSSEVTGVDFSIVAVEGARKKFPDQKWKVVDLNSPPAGLTADIVVCTEVIEHVEDTERFLFNLDKMVRSGGYMILTTQSGKVHQTERMVGHVRHFSISDLGTRLTELRYDVVDGVTWGWPAYVLLKHVANIDGEKTMEALGSGDYGPVAKVANSLAYWLTLLGSFPTAKRGSQIVLVAKKNDFQS